MATIYDIESIENGRRIILEFDTREKRINHDLSNLEAMTEEEACREYNVDYKDEAIQYIINET